MASKAIHRKMTRISNKNWQKSELLLSGAQKNESATAFSCPFHIFSLNLGAIEQAMSIPPT